MTGTHSALLVALSFVVYGMLELLKLVPGTERYLQGYVAVGVNVLLSVATLVVTAAVTGTPMTTPAFWLSVITTAMGAAGIHGTDKNLKLYRAKRRAELYNRASSV